jgi:O-antigen ligase
LARLLLYGGLTAVAVVASIFSPFIGALACLDAYLFNPAVLVGDDSPRFQLIVTVVFIASVAFRKPAGVKRVGRENLAMVLLWGFVALAFASGSWAQVSGEQSVTAAFELFKTLVVISLIIPTINTEKRMEWTVTACIIGVAHAAFAHTFGVRWGYVPRMYSREYGVLPDGQTPVMVLFIPLLLAAAMMGKSKGQRILAMVTLPLALNSVASSYMRTGFVSLAVEGAALLLLMPKRFSLRLAPLVLAVAGLFVFRLTPDDYWQRIETIKAPTEEASAASRFVIADASLRILSDYPLGVGYRNYPDVSPRYLPHELLTDGRRSAHNSFFSVACETGIPGFLVWISAFGTALLLLRRVRKAKRSDEMSLGAYALGMEVGLYGWLICGLFQAEHEVDPAYWFVAFAVVLTRLNAFRLGAVPQVKMRTAEVPSLVSRHWRLQQAP